MLKFSTLFTICFLCFMPAIAQVNPVQMEHAKIIIHDQAEAGMLLGKQKIIDQCATKSQKRWESGITSEMNQGSYNYIQCLEDEIIKIVNISFTNGKKKKEFIEKLSMYKEQTYDLYHMIHHGTCSPCGTVYSGMHINNVSSSLENVLYTVLLYSQKGE